MHAKPQSAAMHAGSALMPLQFAVSALAGSTHLAALSDTWGDGTPAGVLPPIIAFEIDTGALFIAEFLTRLVAGSLAVLRLASAAPPIISQMAGPSSSCA